MTQPREQRASVPQILGQSSTPTPTPTPPPRQTAMYIPPQPQPNPFASVQIDRAATDKIKDGPKYTTVGSLVNPNSTPQFAKPVRRSAAITIRNAQGDALDLSHAWKDAPLQYSPLQQNTDRAISPPTVNVPSVIPRANPLSTNPTPSRTQIPRVSPPRSTVDNTSHWGEYRTLFEAGEKDSVERSENGMGNPGQPMVKVGPVMTTFGIDSPEPALIDDIEDDANEDESLKQMSVKTLTNLASYENPQQRTAQKILSRARETMSARQLADPSTRNRNSIMEWDASVEAEMRANPSPYSSILSKGPGAPRPLTAGPPGLRQHKPTNIEQSTTARRSAPLADDSASVQGSSFLPQAISELGRITNQESSSRISNTFTPATTDTLGTQKLASSIVYDTLDAEDARKYYRNGVLPVNFNDTIRPSTVFGYESSSERYRFGVAAEDGNIQPHDKDINTLWNKCPKLYKSMDTFLTMLRDKRLQLGMGPEKRREENAQEFLAMIRNARSQLQPGPEEGEKIPTENEATLRMLFDEVDRMSAQNPQSSMADESMETIMQRLFGGIPPPPAIPRVHDPKDES
ncbi:hypothetical protein PFICI_02801 [Pestalotiopsis fici W106-1]|uniref:Uncharacterized protein n=1 Tax=Pestalotiopsis fici (strain W106-1 / CGMCC3.15140) TaxID=1229662 RepID=W3XHT4_PESFW|nr:uncharacterized protein PFICI_02801 [Pestalotiopsis fici W106-1]ETS84776.1 hypothetical protein PFICI_02801 [Pestalotiopsis fici W106-1]